MAIPPPPDRHAPGAANDLLLDERDTAAKSKPESKDEQKKEEEEKQKAEKSGRAGGLAADPETGTLLSPHEIHDNVEESAREELDRPAMALVWSALASGLAIGFGFVIGAFLTTLVPEKYHTAVVALAYPIGFVLVVMARQQLFTENTLEPIIPLLEDFCRRTLAKVGRLWGVVLAANMVGALIFALLLARTQMLDEQMRSALDSVAEHAVNGGALIVFYKAIFAGWLVALMAWLLSSTRYTGAQIVLIWLTTGPIAALGFKHSIAGSVEAFYLAARGIYGWGMMAGSFIVPAILGNIVGGVVFVALLNHGQVAHGASE